RVSSRPDGHATSGRVNPGHYLVGMQGLALLRSAITGPRDRAEARLADIRRVVTNPASPLGMEIATPEVDVPSGYARWATTYAAAPNPLIRAEEPVVRSSVDALPPGRALDAACGTGRHAKYLASRGWRVTGVDVTPEMLARAREGVPDADLRAGTLEAL